MRDDPQRAQPLRDRIVVAYRPVALNVARRFARRGEDLDDLEQVATIGLLNALRRFDPSSGKDFLVFAIPTITGELRRHFRDTTWVLRVSRTVQEDYLRVGITQARLTHERGRTPSPAELAHELQISLEKLQAAQFAASALRPSSLDARVADGSAARSDTPFVASQDGFERAEWAATLHGALRRLPRRERQILVMRFFEDMTQKQIGHAIGISQMHVSRILLRTLEALRVEVAAADTV